jgi:hypothetical protein
MPFATCVSIDRNVSLILQRKEGKGAKAIDGIAKEGSFC